MGSTLRLESDDVSRLHARLLIGNSECEIIDEGSTNGTFVDGERVVSHRLRNGNLIQIGRFNLQFISEKLHHNPADFLLPDTTKKGKKIIWSLFLIILVITSFFIYQKISWKKGWLKAEVNLAETSSRYFAEKNKEALYLGEYTSLNLTDLPPQIIQAAIIDRHGKIQTYQPHQSDLLITDAQVDSAKLSYRDKHTLEIYTPIYYNSIRVGTLWILYEIHC